MILHPQTGFDPNKVRKLLGRHPMILKPPTRPRSGVRILSVTYAAIQNNLNHSLSVYEFRIVGPGGADHQLPRRAYGLQRRRTIYGAVETELTELTANLDDHPTLVTKFPADYGHSYTTALALCRSCVHGLHDLRLRDCPVVAGVSMSFVGQWRTRLGRMRKGAELLGVAGMRLNQDEIVLLNPTANLPERENQVRYFASPIDSCWSDGVARDWDDSILVDETDVEYLFD